MVSKLLRNADSYHDENSGLPDIRLRLVQIPMILILNTRHRYAGEEVGLLGSRVMADRYHLRQIIILIGTLD